MKNDKNNALTITFDIVITADLSSLFLHLIKTNVLNFFLFLLCLDAATSGEWFNQSQ